MTRKRGRTDRRGAIRFRADCVVQYWSPAGWQPAVLVNLSRKGVLLRTVHGLVPGVHVQLLLQRAGDGQRVAVRGTVRAVDIAGTHIEFISDFPEIHAWVGNVIRVQVLPAIEQRLSESPADPGLIGELTAWYREMGEDSPELPAAAAKALAAMPPEELASLRQTVEERLQKLFSEIDGLLAVQRKLAQLQDAIKKKR